MDGSALPARMRGHRRQKAQEHPHSAGATDHSPDQRLCGPLRPACGVPGACGCPNLYLTPTPGRSPDPPDFSLWNQVSTFGKEIAGFFQ